jgi:hypothetical protein
MRSMLGIRVVRDFKAVVWEPAAGAVVVEFLVVKVALQSLPAVIQLLISTDRTIRY